MLERESLPCTARLPHLEGLSTTLAEWTEDMFNEVISKHSPLHSRMFISLNSPKDPEKSIPKAGGSRSEVHFQGEKLTWLTLTSKRFYGSAQYRR